ncbi:MAG: NACHT domain-containing protein, partial [Bacteroidota bacterium]
MEPRNLNQRSVAAVLLAALLLQSCGAGSIPLGQVQYVRPVTMTQAGPVGEAREGGSSSSQAKSVGSTSATASASTSATPSAQPSPLQSNNPSTSTASVVTSTDHGVRASLPDLGEKELKRYVYESPITSTQKLVAAFNASLANSKEEQALYQWLKYYVDNRDIDKLVELSDYNGIHEYAVSFSQIQPNTTQKKQLLGRYFNSLIEKVQQVQTSPEVRYVTQALDITLQKIDSKLWEGDTTNLILAINILLDKLERSEFSRATYITHGFIFDALHTALLLFPKVDRNGLSPEVKGGHYETLQQKLSDIKFAAGKYPHSYPIVYHISLLEQSLRRLKLNKQNTDFGEYLERTWKVLKGLSYGYNAGIELATNLKIELDALENSWQTIREALQNNEIPKETWYEQLLELMQKMQHSLQDPNHHEDFLKSVAEIKGAQGGTSNDDEDLQHLRYGAVMQLTMLTLQGESSVRQRSLMELELLSATWCPDQEVIEGIFEGLLSVAKRSSDPEMGESAVELLKKWESPREQLSQITPNHTAGRSWLHKLCTCIKPKVKDTDDGGESVATSRAIALKTWLGTQALQDKLDAPTVNVRQEGANDNSSLSDKVKKRIIGTLPSVQVMRQALEKRYTGLGFTKMAAFAALGSIESNMTVKEMECYLKLNEQVKVKIKDEKDKEAQDSDEQGEVKVKDKEVRDPSGPQDQLTALKERLEWIKTRINPEELFQARKLQPDGPVQEINKVLLVGEAGTGKTSLTKKLAHIWGAGDWEQELEAVYWLPVRNLTQGTGNGIDLLAKAIFEQCFCDLGEKDLSDWKLVIEWQLRKPSTLIILDGLDEQADGVTQAIIRAIKDYPCKLLLTSRPYGIENERSLVNIDVDYVGLAEGQRDRFVRRVLGNDGKDIAEQLLQFIRDHGLRDMAQVPVNLQTLCALWKGIIDLGTSQSSASSILSF